MLRQTYFHAMVGVILAAAAAHAQQTTQGQKVPFTSVGISEWISIVHIRAIPNAPFSATTMMDNVRTLADGTTVTTKTMTTIARDSRGRTHNENRYYLRPSDNGEGRIRDITIFDPEARTRTTLIPATMQATVVVIPPPQQRTTLPDQRFEPPRDDLGESSIDGLSVHGFRQSRTIPAGEDGNDRAIVISDEYWYSEELQMNIAVKHTDPRHGTQSVILTQLKREEPDPKMFEIPPGYTVQNQSETQGPVRISGGVAAANLIQRVDPIYPALAEATRVQGSVEFNVTIGEDGLVKNLQLVRGHPLLINAAKEAVLQWKYRPTLLNGNPVIVMAPVIVNFTLAVH
jgi:TonB family protein